MEHGYNVWVHFTMTHKMNGIGTNINVYLNGIARPDNEKRSTFTENFAAGYDGNLEIGNTKIGKDDQPGYLMMDEIILWERELTPGDVWDLYNTYT